MLNCANVYTRLQDQYSFTFEDAKGWKTNIDFNPTPPVPAQRTLGTTLTGSVMIAGVVPYMDWVCELYRAKTTNKTPVLPPQCYHLDVTKDGKSV